MNALSSKKWCWRWGLESHCWQKTEQESSGEQQSALAQCPPRVDDQ